MSYNNTIFGPVTSSPAIIYNDTNMSSDNISCTNLSGSIATFDQLSVVTFNPISFSADYADIENLSCDNLSCQFKSTFGSISTGNLSGTNITLTGDINASEVNASAVNASNVYADDISTSTITCLANISTPRLYVNDTFFYGSTGSIVASLVTMSSQVLYNLGDLDYKIISVSGTQYLTCDNTLGNVNISNLSVDNLTATIGRIEDLRAQDASVFGNVSVYGNVEAIGRVRVGGIDFKESTSGFKVAYLDVNTASLKMYLNKSMEFRKQDNSGIVFMKIDYAKSNINMSNLSCANISTNLLNNISAGQGISLSTEAGTNKLVITATGELNSSNLSLDNLSTVATSVQEIEYRNNPAGMKSYVSVNSGSVKQYHYSSWQFQKNDDAGIVFMKIDYAAENINISNLSCANISTDLLNNISAGENITLSTESLTNKLIISATGGLNSSNLSLDNLSVDNVSIAGELSTPTIRFKDNTQATKGTWFVYPTAMEMYTQNDFRIRNQGFAGSPSFMIMDTSRNNVNISNLSVSHFDVEFVDLTNNLSDGNNININSVGGKAVISLQDPVNISTITTENMNVSGSAANFFDGANIYGTATVTNLVSDLTNTLSAGTNITITSVGGKAEISSTGGGGSVPANLSIDNLPVNFDATIGGDLKMLSADIIATSSELFIQDVTCTRNMSVANAFGANSVAASSSLTVGTNATVTGNITSAIGNITAVTGQVFAPNVSGTKVTGNNLSVFNDASITRDLKVQRFLDAGKPTFIMLGRSSDIGLSGGGQAAIFNQNTSGQINGQFGTSGGTDVVVTTGGWYRVTWSLRFLRVSNTGGDRAAIRSYAQVAATLGGGYAFSYLKNAIGSSCYIRRNNLCREGHSIGYNLLYIPAGGAVRITMECMVEGASSWNSNFSGMQLQTSSNFMVEYLSSAAET